MSEVRDEEQDAGEEQDAESAPGHVATEAATPEDEGGQPPEEAAVSAPSDETPTEGTGGGTAATASVDVEEPDEDTVEEPDEPEAATPKRSGGTREIARSSGGVGQTLRRNWPVAVLAATTLVLIGGITVALRNASDTPEPKAERPPPPVELETFNDTAARFSIKYPKGWRRLPVPPGAEDLRLVVSVGAQGGDDDGMWVRAVAPERVDQKISEFASEIQQLTGGTPCGAQGSACLLQEQVTVSGLNGVRYAYITKEQQSGQENLHLQYFLRQPQGNLYVLVFQALPKTDLAQLAPAFDQVLASFQVTNQAAGTTTTTTAR